MLDLGQFTQANVSYITGVGHRLYSEDILHTLDSVFGRGDPEKTQTDPVLMRSFLGQILDLPPDSLDAILVWDVLEHLTRPLLAAVLDRIHTVLRPHGALLACFHAELKDRQVQTYSFRIVDSRTLVLHPREVRRTALSFNNRAIERLFEKFSSVKFFLTRDHIREIIVRK